MRRILLIGTLVLASAASVYPQNPFLTPEAQQEGEADAGSPEIYGTRVPAFIRNWSRSLQSSIAGLSRDVRSGQWGAAVLAFGLAIVFGAVHIAGPGHGKMFAISYFSGRHARPRDGLVYSAIANAVDSLSAIVLVLLGYIVLRAVLPGFRTEGPRLLQLVSYSLVVVFGVAHLISHLRSHDGHDHAGHDHAGHEHAHDNDEQVAPGQGRQRPPWLLALSVGLVPCPVSTILIVYGIANDVLLLMIFMVIGVSIGGFLVMSALSLAVIGGRSRVFAAIGPQTAHRLGAILEYTASGLIVLVGIVLLLGTV